MRLYHYSNEVRNEILSKREQGLTKAEVEDSEKKSKLLGLEAPYIDNISFFFDPIPSVLLAELFKGTGHHAWTKGNVLYEHVIETESLEDDLLYRIVESRRQVAFIDEFVKKHNWVEDDPALLQRYLKEIDALQRKWGELGRGRKGLEKQILLNIGRTAEAYKVARARDDWEYNNNKYAANVPHVMAYPSTGRVRVSSVSKLTIGVETRRPVVTPQPASFKW